MASLIRAAVSTPIPHKSRHIPCEVTSHKPNKVRLQGHYWGCCQPFVTEPWDLSQGSKRRTVPRWEDGLPFTLCRHKGVRLEAAEGTVPPSGRVLKSTEGSKWKSRVNHDSRNQIQASGCDHPGVCWCVETADEESSVESEGSVELGGR